MYFTISFVLLLMCYLKILKTEFLNPKEMKTVLNLTKVINEEDLTKCKQAIKNEYYPEIPYVYLFCDENLNQVKNEPDSEKCAGFDCWESQLSLVSRVEIVRTINRYREKVSRGMCKKWCQKNKKRIIFELIWDRDTEVKIVNIMKNCSRNMTKSENFPIDIDGYEWISRTDLSLTSFKMENGTQKELRLILWRLMSENYLNDWDEKTGQFRRSLMYEVGCAFIIRRQTNYVTALNEKIENGNVGHFGCLFHSLLPSVEPPDHLEPSVSNCKSQAGTVPVDFNNYNYFPNLCRVEQTIDVSVLTKSSHFCKEGPTNAKHLCTSSAHSPETWEERFYGLTLRLVNSTELLVKGDCNVPKDIPQPTKFEPNVFNYNCTLKEKVSVLADNSNCLNWNCKDSQLTDITRLKILERLNEARELVASGKCWSECPSPCAFCNGSIRYCNIAKLQWHWFLERKASQIVRNCSSVDTFQENITYEDSPFSDPAVFDEVSLVLNLSLQSGGQISLGGKVFTELFWTNKFKDWSNNNKFKRGNAAFVGCSIIVRPNVKISTTTIHVVCIYATLQNEFISIAESSNKTHCCPTCMEPVYETRPCQLRYVKHIPPYPDLCTSTALQLTMNCADKSHCSDNGYSQAWDEEYAGVAVYQTINGSFLTIIRNLKPTPSPTTSTLSPTTSTPSPTTSTLSPTTSTPPPTPSTPPPTPSTPPPTPKPIPDPISPTPKPIPDPMPKPIPPTPDLTPPAPKPTPDPTPEPDPNPFEKYCLILFILTLISALCFPSVIILRWKSIPPETSTLPSLYLSSSQKTPNENATTEGSERSEDDLPEVSTPKLKPSGNFEKVPK